jgi:tRNA A37 threonylcarbamoyltransferase TsaD
MKVLGIETSCDECAAAVVEDGANILSNVVATQIPFHALYEGVVPEIASRKHIEWIQPVALQALDQARLRSADIDAVAATSHPGLLGALLVGLTFAKTFAWSLGVPFIAVDHMLAHLYASRLVGGGSREQGAGNRGREGNREQGTGNRGFEAAVCEATGRFPGGQKDSLTENPVPGPRSPVPSSQAPLPAPRSPFPNESPLPTPHSPPPTYPFLGLLVSGGHSIICRADNFDDITILGTTIDDAVGEAFDKVAKHYGFGYPGGPAIERLARGGNPEAYRFPLPSLHKGQHPFDLSYSGLKTAVINQAEQFRVGNSESPSDLAASFQKTAIDILLRSLFRAVEATGLRTIVAGGGVAANSRLREALAAHTDLSVHFPPLELCGDNGAMVAGLGYQYLARGETSPLEATASARVQGFKRRYP